MTKYTLTEKDSRSCDMVKVTLVADSNDGDYITEIDTYTLEHFNSYIIDGLIHLLQNASGAHELGEYDNPYDISIPYNGWDGYCHTLESLTVEYTDENGKVWDIDINEDYKLENK